MVPEPGWPQYFADLLTLFKPGRVDYPQPLLLAPPNFFTFRHHCGTWDFSPKHDHRLIDDLCMFTCFGYTFSVAFVILTLWPSLLLAFVRFSCHEPGPAIKKCFSLVVKQIILSIVKMQKLKFCPEAPV